MKQAEKISKEFVKSTLDDLLEEMRGLFSEDEFKAIYTDAKNYSPEEIFDCMNLQDLNLDMCDALGIDYIETPKRMSYDSYINWMTIEANRDEIY